MTRRISLRIAGKAYDMELDAEFARSLEPEIEHLFRIEGDNSVKQLLEAYIKKSYETYTLKKSIKNNLSKLD